MEKAKYSELINTLKPEKLPESFPQFFEDWDGRGHMVTEEEMMGLLGRYDLPEDRVTDLKENLKKLWENDLIVEYIKFLTYAQCDRRYDYYVEGDSIFDLKGVPGIGDKVTFYMCLSCVFHAKKELERRNIPFELYEDIPHRMLRDQMKKFAETGRYDIFDLQWKSNFYSLAIYLFDRFLFVPCKMDDPYTFYRRGAEVVGIPDAGLSVDTEGQIILQDEDETGKGQYEEEGSVVKNGYYYGAFKKDRKEDFVTTKSETEDEITGYRLSPCGYITKEVITLKKAEWKQIMKKGSWMLGFHIPAGEGYEPKRVRSSMLLAWDFFKKYYPEVDFKGFWSSSWLYDGRLSILLPKDSRIVRVQRQLYNYSGGWNGEMLYHELYGDRETPLSEVPQNSSLQRDVKKYFEEGKKFAEPGMVYFPEELTKDYNNMIYITKEDLEKQRQLFERIGLKGVGE